MRFPQMNDRHLTIKKPTQLSPGDTIGVVAPAGPFDPDLFQKGITALEVMGYRVFQPEGLTLKDRFLAGSDQHRADLLNQLFANPGIKGVFCARGGYGSLRLLDLIDYDLIWQNPKVFIGFSDISALIWVLMERCGLVAFHGPVITTLGQGNAETAASLTAALTSGTSMEIQASNTEVISVGKCKGTVRGGNLATLCHLTGTPYTPEFKGSIAVLEDVGEAPYKIDRMLCQMRMAGCFDGIAGLALGTFADCGNIGDVLDVFKDVFRDIDIPILAGFDIGHGPVNLTLPMGIQATLDTERQTLSYTEAALL
jgi:muramoyltetrapeptide carboxypeptidase